MGGFADRGIEEPALALRGSVAAKAGRGEKARERKGERDEKGVLFELANGCLCCTVADEFLPKVLADLAVSDPAAFTAIAEQVKAAL